MNIYEKIDLVLELTYRDVQRETGLHVTRGILAETELHKGHPDVGHTVYMVSARAPEDGAPQLRGIGRTMDAALTRLIANFEHAIQTRLEHAQQSVTSGQKSVEYWLGLLERLAEAELGDAADVDGC